jgi:hypothetical protein
MKTSRTQQETVGNEDWQVEEDKQKEKFGREKSLPSVGTSDPELTLADQRFVMDEAREHQPPAYGNKNGNYVCDDFG